MDRPARTFVLPVPLSRWSHHTPRSRRSQRNIGTAHLIPVINAVEAKIGRRSMETFYLEPKKISGKVCHQAMNAAAVTHKVG
jgi:hypothetical protein